MFIQICRATCLYARCQGPYAGFWILLKLPVTLNFRSVSHVNRHIPITTYPSFHVRTLVLNCHRSFFFFLWAYDFIQWNLPKYILSKNITEQLRDKVRDASGDSLESWDINSEHISHYLLSEVLLPCIMAYRINDGKKWLVSTNSH